ncbi:MAG: peptidoglycan-binding protein [Alphaproteobacteria bacterium]
MTIIDDRKAALLARVRDYGGPLNEPAVLAQFLAQVMHESGGLRYVREIWGPTKAQRGYEGRKDLGNTQPGDGKRFMGRDVIQVTGRANYRALSKWAGFDFEAKPEALESPEWLGIGAIWYFLTRKGLLDYARAGNIEMVTRRVNGGLNGYADRLRWYDRIALEMLKAPDVRTFQKQAGLAVDGISGPKTRAALHEALSHVSETPVSVTRPAPHVNAEAQKRPAQRVSAPKPSQVKEIGKTAAGGAAGAGVAYVAYQAVVTFGQDIAQGWRDFWVYVFSFFN